MPPKELFPNTNTLAEVYKQTVTDLIQKLDSNQAKIEQYLLPASDKAREKLQQEGNVHPTDAQIKEKIKTMPKEELFPSAAKIYKQQAINLLDRFDTWLSVKTINKQGFQTRVKRNLIIV